MKEKKNEKYVTIKVLRQTRDRLRVLSATTGKSMVECLEELLAECRGDCCRKNADDLTSCRLVGVDFELNSITLEVDPGIMKNGFNFGNVKIDLSSVQLR